MISQSEAPEPEEIEFNKHQRYTSSLSAETGETGLTAGTRVIVTPEKRNSKKKNNIKPHRFVSIKKGSNFKSG